MDGDIVARIYDISDKNICARWIPRMPTQKHMKKHMGAALLSRLLRRQINKPATSQQVFGSLWKIT